MTLTVTFASSRTPVPHRVPYEFLRRALLCRYVPSVHARTFCTTNYLPVGSYRTTWAVNAGPQARGSGFKQLTLGVNAYPSVPLRSWTPRNPSRLRCAPRRRRPRSLARRGAGHVYPNPSSHLHPRPRLSPSPRRPNDEAAREARSAPVESRAATRPLLPKRHP